MSNLYLLHQMVLNIDKFSERLKRLYESWNNPETPLENDVLSGIDCFVVAVGDDYDLIYNKSLALHIWLFGYELNDTICVFTRDTVYIQSSKKEIEFLEQIENRPKTDGSEPDVKLILHDQNHNDDESFKHLLNVISSSRNGKPIGVFGNDGFPGEFCASWQKVMASHNFQTRDIGASVAYIMAVKDEYELKTMKEASLVSVDVFEKYLKLHIAEIIDAKKRVKHSQLAKGAQRALLDKKTIPNVDILTLEMCYPPTIQSGGCYDLSFDACSDQRYLDPGVIVCSLGVRYKSYCSNLSRTLLHKPSKDVQSNFNFLKNLESKLLEYLISGARLNEVYQSTVDYVNRVRPDLVEHLMETFGSAIGIELDERSLAIGPNCMAIVKKDMVFNVRVGLNHLTNSHESSDSKVNNSYALLHSDTVVVNESSPATILTSPPAYLKLIADCWEHIFDYLPFKDIIAMERTCIRMHRMAGYYIRVLAVHPKIVDRQKSRLSFGCKSIFVFSDAQFE